MNTFDSIVSQSYDEWEWIVTDDCSSDSSLDILKELQVNDSRVKVLQNLTNLGAASARNLSLSQAKGRFVAFIDADDLWDPSKLLKQINFMLTGGYGVSFTPFKVINEKGQDKGLVIDTLAPSPLNYHELLLKKATFGCSTVMVDRALVGNFKMPNLRTGQDYATWLSILKKGFSAHLLREPLTSYRIVKGSISRNKVNKAIRQWCIYRDIEGLPPLFSLYCFVNYVYRAIFRS